MLKKLAFALLLTAVCMSAQAHAAPDPLPQKQDVAGSRPQPEFDTIGIRLGPWVASPTLRIDSGYDSNLFGTATDKDGDGYIILTPSLDLKSDWGRNSLDFAATGTFTRYYQHSKPRSNEYDIHGGGQLEFGRTSLSASASVALTSERNGANGAPLSTGRPSQFRSFTQRVGVEQDLLPLRLSLEAEHSKISYNDLVTPSGSRISQEFRDSNQWTIRGGATYQPTDIAAFGIFALYRHSGSSVSSRASKLTNAGANGAIDLGLIRLNSEVGYMWQRYSNSVFRDFNGLTYASTVNWYPTSLLTIGLIGRKSLENSGNPIVGVIVTHSVKADIDYELLRNFMLSLSASRKWQDFREVHSHALSRNEELKGEYKFNRTVAIGAYARHECRDSSNIGVIRNFCATLAGLSLTFRR